MMEGFVADYTFTVSGNLTYILVILHDSISLLYPRNINYKKLYPGGGILLRKKFSKSEKVDFQVLASIYAEFDGDLKNDLGFLIWGLWKP